MREGKCEGKEEEEKEIFDIISQACGVFNVERNVGYLRKTSVLLVLMVTICWKSIVEWPLVPHIRLLVP